MIIVYYIELFLIFVRDVYYTTYMSERLQ